MGSLESGILLDSGRWLAADCGSSLRHVGQARRALGKEKSLLYCRGAADARVSDLEVGKSSVTIVVHSLYSKWYG